MQKFVIKNRKKRKYTKKAKIVTSFSITNALFGVLPLLIIFVAFMATYFISSPFRSTLVHMKFAFQFPTLPSFSVTSIGNAAAATVSYVFQECELMWFAAIAFILNSQKYIDIFLLTLLKFPTQLNLADLTKPMYVSMQSTGTFITQLIAQSIIFFTICRDDILAIYLRITNSQTHITINPVPLFKPLLILNRSIITININIFTTTANVLVRAAFFPYAMLLQAAQITLRISIYVTFLLYLLSSNIVIIVSDIFSYITATLVPHAVSLYRIIGEEVTLIYSATLSDISTVAQIISFALNTSFELISSFFISVITMIGSFFGGIIHLLLIPFNTLHEGIMEISPYVDVFDQHLKMAGIDFTNCFNSFEKISAMVRNHN